jgi:hypothetical protein
MAESPSRVSFERPQRMCASKIVDNETPSIPFRPESTLRTTAIGYVKIKDLLPVILVTESWSLCGRYFSPPPSKICNIKIQQAVEKLRSPFD